MVQQRYREEKTQKSKSDPQFLQRRNGAEYKKKTKLSIRKGAFLLHKNHYPQHVDNLVDRIQDIDL